MGSKGQSTQNVSQTQSYAPNPAIGQAGGQALNMAQGAANQPFQTPVAPVAGFSPDQLSAFQATNNAQGMAQPYYQAGANLVQQGATPNVSQYFNPFASSVLGGLQDVFGQQMQETTGNLTQAAGGVGADRIAVGQSELARQQGLSAGQTLAGIYSPAVSEALMGAQLQQGAGYGLGQLGAGAQGSQLQGIQAQLGTGGLQQQLSQAQMNAPYQNTLQRLAYPYQNAQFLAGITGGLAPALGGTTSGQGTTVSQPPPPSIWSQLVGAGTLGLGVYGAGQQQGWWGNGTGQKAGGRVSPFAAGGAPFGADPFANEGGPSIVPDMQLQPMPVQHPTLNLNPPASGGGGGGGGGASNVLGDISSLAKMAAMFANRGGRAGYADGGSPDGFPDDLPPAHYDFSAAPRAVAGALAPGLTHYLTDPAPPPQITPNAAGKVPSPFYNPNALPAMQDVTNAAMAAIPFGRAASMVGEAAPFAARAAETMVPSENSALEAMSPRGSVAGFRRLGAAAGFIPTGAAAEETTHTDPLGPRPTIATDEKAEVDRLNKEITGLSAQRAKATKDLGPKGAAIQAKNFDDQIAQRNAQISTIMGQVTERQNAYDKRAEEYAEAGQPFSVRNSDLVNQIRTGSLGLSAVTGFGRGLKRLGLPGTLAAGAIEGGAGVLFPSAVDITKPPDTEAAKSVQRNMRDPNFWGSVVAPDAVYGAILAAAGHGPGHAISAPFGKSPSRLPTSPVAPSPVAPALPAPTIGRYGRAWPDDWRKVQGDIKTNTTGQWTAGGKFMPGNLVDDMRKGGHPAFKGALPGGGAPPGTMLNAPERAAGGTVRGYDDGGGTSFDDQFSAAYPAKAPVGSPYDPMDSGYLPNRTAAFLAGQKYPLGDIYSVDNAGNPTGNRFGLNPAPYPMFDRQAIARGEQNAAIPATGRPNLPIAPTAPDASPFVPPSRMQSDQEPPDNQQLPPPPPSQQPRSKSLAQSPWMALMAAGLGIMGGTSPYAGVNIGKGGLEGIKELGVQESAAQRERSIELAAERLTQQAQFHQDQYNKVPASEQAKLDLEARKPQTIGRNIWGQPVMGVYDPKTQGYVDPVTKKPVDTSQIGEADDTSIEAMAKGIANYQNAPISPYRQVTPAGMMIMNRVRQLNPDYDQKFYGTSSTAQKAFATGRQGDSVRAFSVATSHLDTLSQLTDALNNGDVKAFNAIGNFVATQTGKPAPTNFNAAKAIVADEIIKAIVGSRGALADREDAQKQIDAANSPAQLKGVIETYKKLMGGQLQGLKRQYEVNTHAHNFEEFLSPEAQREMTTASAAPPTSTPAMPPEGTRQQFKQGWGIVRGGKWVPEAAGP